MDLLYLETAETNLIYALGKHIQASSSRSGANITVSDSSFTKVQNTFASWVKQHTRLSSYLTLTSLLNTYRELFRCRLSVLRRSLR